MAVSVTSFGATGNGSTDDTAAIQAAMDGTPLDAQLTFPVGVYKILAPINVTRRIRIVGESTRGAVIKCGANWVGAQMFRNWTDTDWNAGNNGNRPDTTVSPQYYPQLESMRFDTNGNAGVTCLAWVHMQETAFMRDLAFKNTAANGIAIALFSNFDPQGSHNGGSIRGVTCYGTAWKHELLLNASGSDLRISDWTTAPTLHSDSPFNLKCIDVTMDNIHCEAFLDDTAPATAAIFETKCLGFVLRDSFYSLHANMPRPFLTARNPNGAGFGYSCPVVKSVRFYNEGGDFAWTGPLLVDSTQPNSTRTIAGISNPSHLYSYDGVQLVYADGSNGNMKTRAFVSSS